MGWAEAIALGAIVSPPGCCVSHSHFERLHIPRRVVTILEGESLVNDATALVLYRTAVGAAVSGTFVLSETLIEFVYAAVVGVAIGIGVGMVLRWALRVTEDSFTEIAITLLAPYIAWVLGELGHASAGAGVRGRGAVSPAAFQRCRGSADANPSARRLGSSGVRVERFDFYLDRPSARDAA